MNMKRSILLHARLLCAAGAAGLALGWAHPAVAADAYPTRTVRIVVPFPPGTAADALPRLVAERLSVRWGQAVVIENRPGAAGNIGADAVAKAAPDGYTLLASPPPPIAINQSLYPRLPYDPNTFVPVTIIGTAPNVLAVHPLVPVRDVAELVALSRSRPGGLNYASSGSGGTPHLSMEQLKAFSGATLLHVPYKGLAPALTDLLAGRVDAMFLNVGDAIKHSRAGTLRIIAVASARPLPDLPAVPTVAEVYPGFVSTTWYAIVAPQGTPPALVTQLSSAIADLLQQPNVAAQLREMWIQPARTSPAETAAFIQEEVQRWSRVIASAGVKLDD
jgi:tripartite-type tricarboxylate transporter receptor subunit TctC